MSKTKVCNKCGLELPRTEFFKHKEMADGLRGACKSCCRARTRAWEKAHPERVKAIRKQQYAKHPLEAEGPRRDRLRERNRNYMRRRRANMTPEQRKEEAFSHYYSDVNRARKWSRENQRQRRAAIKQSPGHFTEEEFQALCESYGNQCLACGRTDVRLSPDHVKPLSKMGPNVIENIQPLCRFCNQSKGAKEIDYRPLYEQCRHYMREGK